MPQNRTKTFSKSNNQYLKLLQNGLFQKFDEFQSENIQQRPRTSTINRDRIKFSPQIEHTDISSFEINKKPSDILLKAKQITLSKKQQIEQAKKAFKTSKKDSDGMFLTGCSLYANQQHHPDYNDDFQSVDMQDALKYLISYEKDDLEQLRKMIKQTKSNLNQYSEQTFKIQSGVLGAADKFGKQLNIDLKMKINRCGLDRNIGQSQKKSIPQRKISTSQQFRVRNNQMH